MREQLLTTEYAILVAQQKDQQAVLTRRERNVLTANSDSVASGISGNTTRRDDFGAVAAASIVKTLADPVYEAGQLGQGEPDAMRW